MMGVKFTVYLLVFLLIGGIIYFFLIWRPGTTQVEELRRSIVAAESELESAHQRALVHPELLAEVDRLSQEFDTAVMHYEWNNHVWQDNFAWFMPEVFDENDMRQRISRLIEPYSSFVTVDIGYSQPLSQVSDSDNPHGPEGIWITPINIAFATDTNSVWEILRGFANEGIDNRINYFDMIRQGDLWAMTMQLDVLTQTPYRHNGDYTLQESYSY